MILMPAQLALMLPLQPMTVARLLPGSDQAEVDADQQTEQPPSRVRRVFKSANTEPFHW